MRTRLLRLLGIFLIGAALGVPAPGGAQAPPLHSVFQVLVMNRANGRAVAAGTGFFIDSDGTALTSSHVVYPARASRSGYEVLAVVNREFYGVEIRCASELPYDPMKSAPHGAGRDVAEIRLTEPSSAFDDELVSSGVHVARRHMGRLPKFPWLALGNDPVVGDSVRILGFGNLAAPLQYEWSATGQVRSIESAPDGTSVFVVTFARKTEPGHSGAPVLNLRDQVVGIHAWHLAGDPTIGLAISGSALSPACR